MNEHGIPERADAIVIGAGALGAATAFHLAKAGLFVALLDKAELASQSSPRAAGLSGQLRSDPTMTRIAARGVEKIVNFQAETGEPMVFFQPGSLKIARRPEHEAQLHEEVARGEATRPGRRDDPARRSPAPDAVSRDRRRARRDAHAHRRLPRAGSGPARLRTGEREIGRCAGAEYARRGDPHGGRLRRRRAHASRGDPSALSWSTRAARGSAFWLRRADRQ